jgi:hypothetical protein
VKQVLLVDTWLALVTQEKPHSNIDGCWVKAWHQRLNDDAYNDGEGLG